ncbi:hypothetical protein KHS38_08255 [Mucilaginibacter sp. Bleaf8]|uniref:hypothetical protein n=1 Tax=Mucilaginibacter sp. Bleaf8 TaxID=2834430 RepID=UPI001BD19307|nr:hypothetical protein [Mucilaginibacter sp. Bleaf8]MBS7564397.1 hypothetical protein [Mucilaginibacter sp. Bleaf8]
MKKFTLMMALACTVTATQSFAHDKDKGKEKCTAGKECCKKMSKASASAKAKCAKMCADAKKA